MLGMRPVANMIWPAPKVAPSLSVTRTPSPDRDLRAEAEVMEHVRAAGYPVPRVFRVGPGEMVLERVDGSSAVQRRS